MSETRGFHSIFKFSTAGPPVEIAPNRWRAIASTTALDRERDHILGWDLADYTKNPVLLYNHQISELVGKVTSLSPEGQTLRCEFELLPEGVSERADFCRAALRHGSLRGLSISFLAPERKGNAAGGMDYPVARVLEISLTPLPANQEALAAALGGKPAPEPVLLVTPSEPVYGVSPALLANAMSEAVRVTVRRAVCLAAGRLDDSEEDLAHVRLKMQANHVRSVTVDGLRQALGGHEDRPVSHDLAPGAGETFRELRDAARPVKMPEPLVIPHRILQRVVAGP